MYGLNGDEKQPIDFILRRVSIVLKAPLSALPLSPGNTIVIVFFRGCWLTSRTSLLYDGNCECNHHNISLSLLRFVNLYVEDKFGWLTLIH